MAGFIFQLRSNNNNMPTVKRYELTDEALQRALERVDAANAAKRMDEANAIVARDEAAAQARKDNDDRIAQAAKEAEIEANLEAEQRKRYARIARWHNRCGWKSVH